MSRTASPPSTLTTTALPLSSDKGAATAPMGLVIAAFAAVYLVWGSTYLGIRLAIDSIPPLLMAGTRFLVAGAVLYVFMRLRGAPRPEFGHWIGAAIVGGLLLMAGNGGVTWAQQTVPSGIAALVVAAVPLWIMLADWLRPNGKRPTVTIVIGLLIGIGGVTTIILGRGELGQRMVPPAAAVVLVSANICWALGSIYARHARKPESPLLAIAMQMLCGGGMQFLLGLCLGEGAAFDASRITATSAWAFVYLTFIGSLVGFPAYVWLLQVSTPAKVSTHAYVNPFVAVLLGYWFLHEPLPHSVLIAGTLILTSVLLITRPSTPTSSPSPS